VVIGPLLRKQQATSLGQLYIITSRKLSTVAKQNGVAVLQKGEWLQFPSMPETLQCHCMTMTESRLIITGGISYNYLIRSAAYVHNLPAG